MSATKVVRTAAAAGFAVAAYSYGYERKNFVLREYTVPVLPAGADDIKVLHFSDLHITPNQQWKIDWVRSLAALEPDFVINTGDNLSHVDSVPEALHAFEPFFKTPGAFVPGSNDYFAPTKVNPLKYLTGPSSGFDHSKQPARVKLPTDDLHHAFEVAGWINLINRNDSLMINGTRLDLSGVDDPHIDRDQYVGFPTDLPADEQAVRIGVTHAPYLRVLDEFTVDNAAIIFAGHTHGGQLRIPGYGAIVSNCDLPVDKARGLSEWFYQGRGSWLQVSAGLGTSPFFPFRFGCRPEACLVTLTAVQ